MKKNYQKPLLEVHLVLLEDNILTASIVTGGTGSVPMVEEETTQPSDLVEWNFN